MSREYRGASAPRTGDVLQVRIEKMAVGGAGVAKVGGDPEARDSGFVLFVDDTAPGDLAEVRVTKAKDRFGEASLLRVIEPGPSRRTPPCVYADRCGGCSWQHITEDAQRSEKQNLMLELLKKFLPGEKPVVDPLVPSPHVLHYRNRMQPHVVDGRLGFHVKRSHDFLPVADCLVAEQPLRPFFQEDWVSRTGREKQRLEISVDRAGQPHWRPANEAGEGFGFSQVNRFQNETLISTMLEWVGDGYSEVWDLYSGAGNFTFPLQKRFSSKPVMAVEGSSLLVQKGKETGGPQGPRFFVSDVGTFLRRWSPPKDALIVLDPPRAGAGLEVMTALAATKPRAVVYIACHPVSLARDVAGFLEDSRGIGHPMKLERLRVFEMFPQTDHFETMALLSVD